jgi:hypothetical protein
MWCCVNIFAVDHDPEIAAQSLHDVHVNKMLVESCQLLATAHPADASPYSHTHFNHPCARWTRESAANYAWLACHALALAAERAWRWPERPEHASLSAALWYATHAPPRTYDGDITSFAIAVPQELHVPGDAVASYRAYYAARKLIMKRGTVRWTGRRPPDWLYALVDHGQSGIRLDYIDGRYEAIVCTAAERA